MSAIWHDHGMPSFLGIKPSYSFHDLAEIVAPAPETYVQARARLQRLERKLGGGSFLQHNAILAHEFYMAKRAWWLSL